MFGARIVNSMPVWSIADRTAPLEQSRRICITVKCELFPVSLSCMYKPKTWWTDNYAFDGVSGGPVVEDVVARAGVSYGSMKQYNGSHEGYLAVSELPGYNCCCSDPCFAQPEPVWLQG